MFIINLRRDLFSGFSLFFMVFISVTFFSCAGTKAGWSLVEEPGLFFISDSERVSSKDGPVSFETSATLELVAWKGEKVNGQLICYTDSRLADVDFEITADSPAGSKLIPYIRLYKEGMVKGDLPGVLYGDSLLSSESISLEPNRLTALWFSLEVPLDLVADEYQFEIKTVIHDKSYTSSVEVDVIDLALPAKEDRTFHLDLWQNPFAIARYHEVELWSDEHFKVMKPYLEMLADAGQKLITVSMIDKPWNGQTFDPFKTMIEWNKQSDGSFVYDYAIFDRWVSFAMECGIDKTISCYTMIPWHNKFQFYNEESGEYEVLKAEPGSEAFEAHWRPFLVDFSQHLREKGWLEKTSISMDERAESLMIKLLDFVKEAAPDLKITSACNYQTEMTKGIDDISLILNETTEIDPQWMSDREEKGLETTYYVCTGPARPNTFIHSLPGEAEWLGWYTAAKDFSGFLRWAYNSWPEAPLDDTSFGNWPDGDTFLVYPGPVSSVRFEKLIDGIEIWEKVKIIKAMVAADDSLTEQGDELEIILDTFSWFSTLKSRKAVELALDANSRLDDLIKDVLE